MRRIAALAFLAVAGPDAALLRRVAVQERVATGENVSVTEYLVHLRNRLLERLAGGLAKSGVFEVLIRVLPWVLLAVVALGIGWQVHCWFRDRDPSRGTRHDPQAEPLAPETAAADLRARLDACLARGDGRGALGALWRLVATTLETRGLGRFAEERTNREFVETVRQAAPAWGRLPGLDDFARATDRLLYGEHEVGPAAVRALLPAAEELLA